MRERREEMRERELHSRDTADCDRRCLGSSVSPLVPEKSRCLLARVAPYMRGKRETPEQGEPPPPKGSPDISHAS